MCREQGKCVCGGGEKIVVGHITKKCCLLFLNLTLLFSHTVPNDVLVKQSLGKLKTEQSG